MECVGTLDEFRAHLALVRVLLASCEPFPKEEDTVLYWLQRLCFLIGAHCSDPLHQQPQFHPGSITDAHVKRLENIQEQIEEKVQLPHAFIVGATTRIAAELDITCTIARRFERTLARLGEVFPESQPPELMAFVNRVSDVLFLLARVFDKGQYQTISYTDYAILNNPDTYPDL